MMETASVLSQGKVGIEALLAFYHPDVKFNSMDALQGKMVVSIGIEVMKAADYGNNYGLYDTILNKYIELK